MKSKFADLSVKNSGLKTNFRLLNFNCRFLVVPGIIVERIKIIVSSLVIISEISLNALSRIVKSALPSLFDGVGTETKTKSLLLIVSSIGCNDLDGS